MNKYKEAINYFKDFEEGDNITITCDFCNYVEALEELVSKILENKVSDKRWKD